MKKEYIVYRIDNSLFTSFNVKRGLRNEDGTGVLVGLTKIGNVVGYEKTEEGLKPIPGKLFYRGYDLDDIVHALLKEKRFGFEEVAYEGETFRLRGGCIFASVGRTSRQGTAGVFQGTDKRQYAS